MSQRSGASLPLPSRALGLVLGWFHIDGKDAASWPAAADRIEVVSFADARGELAAWMLRVDDARPTRWAEVSFEDQCVVGDAGGSLELADDDAAPSGDLAMVRNDAGAPLLCVQGPDLSIARAHVGLDAEGRITTMVVIS